MFLMFLDYLERLYQDRCFYALLPDSMVSWDEFSHSLETSAVQRWDLIMGVYLVAEASAVVPVNRPI